MRLEGKSLTEADEKTLHVICRKSGSEDWIHSVRYIKWTQQNDAELEGLGWNLVHVFCKHVVNPGADFQLTEKIAL
jgi:hypothetical protein